MSLITLLHFVERVLTLSDSHAMVLAGCTVFCFEKNYGLVKKTPGSTPIHNYVAGLVACFAGSTAAACFLATPPFVLFSDFGVPIFSITWFMTNSNWTKSLCHSLMNITPVATLVITCSEVFRGFVMMVWMRRTYTPIPNASMFAPIIIGVVAGSFGLVLTEGLSKYTSSLVFFRVVTASIAAGTTRHLMSDMENHTLLVLVLLITLSDIGQHVLKTPVEMFARPLGLASTTTTPLVGEKRD